MNARRKILPIIKGVAGAARPRFVHSNDVAAELAETVASDLASELRIHAERGTSFPLRPADARYIASMLEQSDA